MMSMLERERMRVAAQPGPSSCPTEGPVGRRRLSRRRLRILAIRAFPLLLCCSTCNAPSAAAAPKSEDPLRAIATVQDFSYQLGNSLLAASFFLRDGHLQGLRVEDKSYRRQIDLEEPFTLRMVGGASLRASELSVAAAPVSTALESIAASTRTAEHLPGRGVCADFADPSQDAQLQWCLVLRDGSRYLRETLTIRAGNHALPIEKVTLLRFHDPGASVSGTVAGSPVVDRTAFYGFEHPLAQSVVRNGEAELSIKRVLPLQPHQVITYSAIIGTSEPAQMRRSFLTYLERERIHPYRTFLTYNSWYDLGAGERYDEAGALDRVHAFGEELTRKRSVSLDSFLFDDGWDNAKSLWQFHPGFPNGFTRVAQAASAYGAGIGVWLSPWGGYDEAKKTRIAYGREHGYEIVKDGYALSGPRYYQAFEQTCVAMIDNYKVNQFKFDGTGNADQVVPGSAYDSDFDAAIHLIDHLRRQAPGIFINLTTGTYPSPFWLEYADSIWRGGEDHDFAGVGTWRQKWITYRDAQTYKNIVKGGPLFPLNSLMLHGIIDAREAEHLGDDAVTAAGTGTTTAEEKDKDFADEVWSFFGTGTDMQELYLTPALLSQRNWDVLAAAAKWSRRNSEVLRDTHWIGGDPAALEPYGWASWSAAEENAKGIIVVRNPSNHAQPFTLDAGAAFELVGNGPRSFRLASPRDDNDAKLDRQLPTTLLRTKPQRIKLAPFQVITIEASPQ